MKPNPTLLTLLMVPAIILLMITLCYMGIWSILIPLGSAHTPVMPLKSWLMPELSCLACTMGSAAGLSAIFRVDVAKNQQESPQDWRLTINLVLGLASMLPALGILYSVVINIPAPWNILICVPIAASVLAILATIVKYTPRRNSAADRPQTPTQ